MNAEDVVRNLKALAELLPKPGSGQERMVGSRLVTHYDPEVEAVHEAIRLLAASAR